jgi:hypothetical protein
MQTFGKGRKEKQSTTTFRLNCGETWHSMTVEAGVVNEYPRKMRSIPSQDQGHLFLPETLTTVHSLLRHSFIHAHVSIHLLRPHLDHQNARSDCIPKPSTRSPSLPSENLTHQDTIAVSLTAHAEPLQSLPALSSPSGPSTSPLDAYSPWSSDDEESNWESASVATSTSTTSAASDVPLSPLHASSPTPFLHPGSDRGDGERRQPLVASILQRCSLIL